MIEVLQAGIMTTVQDLGRPHLRHLGIPQSGAVDTLALMLGNRLVGNEATAAGLEIHAGTPVRLRFLNKIEIALTGGELKLEVEQQRIWPGWRVQVTPGQTLTIGTALQGFRAYLSVAGGIDVPLVLGSRSTDRNAGFGGWQGRALLDGDRLPIGQAGSQSRVSGLRLPVWSQQLRALTGPEYEEFSESARDQFWNTNWTVRPESNRMGYRLQGQALQRDVQRELLSHAVWPGTVQVPPSGEPIILLADAQTTGGYPRIATVIDADLWKLAQIPLGGQLRFAPCTRAEARLAWQRLQRYLKRIEQITHAN